MSQKIKTSVEIDGSLSASQIANATVDTDKFLVSDNGTVKYRTGAQMLSDLGVSPGTASRVQHQVKAGVAINKGQAVYVTSADGTNMIVGLASNASESTSSKTMGLLNATVSINGFADVITEGLLTGLNTIGANAGDPVWLGTGGNLIYGLANKPYAPNHLVFIGIVTRVNANNGEIFVKVQNGFELDEIHDVDLKTTTKINGHLLGYNGSLWVNKTIAEWLGYTPYNASNPAGYISSYTETDTLQTVTDRGSITTNPITINSTSLQHLTLNNRFNLIGSENFHISNNAYYNSGFKYKFAGNASKIALNSDNSFVFQTAATGTPDATVTFENKFWADSAGNALSTGSMRSPIFYDSNDTTYYGDFNSTTRQYQAISFGDSSRYSAINTTINGAGAGDKLILYGGVSNYDARLLVGADYDMLFKSQGNSAGRGSFKFYSGQNCNLAMTIDGSQYTSLTGGLSVAGNSSWFGGYGSGSGPGLSFENQNTFARIVFWGLDFYDWNHGTQMVIDNGYVSANNSFRAPIFYDSNNTGYYVDPASTSNLNGLTVASTISGNVSGTSRKINIGSAQTITDLNISVGDAGSVMFDTFQSGALNKPVSGNNANGVITFSMAHGPQYGKQIAFADDDDLYIRRLTANSYASWRKILHSGNYTSFNYFDMPYGGNEISGMGPITNWDSRPGVGMAGFGINWHTGVSISGYGGYGGVRLYASGYPTHSGSVLRLEASDSVKTYGTFTNDSSVRSPIFYDSNDTTYYVDPAGSATRAAFLNGNLWINPKSESYGEGVTFNMPNQGTWGGLRWYRNGPAGSYAGNWAFGYFGNESNNDVGFHNGTNGWRLDHSFNMTSIGSVRSPIFYDSNNTGYYVDPGSTSSLNVTNTGILTFRGVGGDSGVGSIGDMYGIYQQGGAWNYPFPDLCIGYHTGIKIGAYYSYNGTRFYNNSDWATITASVNDGDNNFRGYYDVIAYASDRRLKHKVKPIEDALSKVKSLTGMTYQWNEIGKEHGWDPDTEVREAGVFAQDVQAVLPEAVRLAPFDDEHGVSRSGESFLTVKYDKIVPLLIEAIKEQQTQIEELKELVNKLINK